MLTPTNSIAVHHASQILEDVAVRDVLTVYCHFLSSPHEFTLTSIKSVIIPVTVRFKCKRQTFKLFKTVKQNRHIICVHKYAISGKKCCLANAVGEIIDVKTV